MQVECHIIAWNEAEIIDLTIKHYQEFCTKIVLHDNYSSDGTDKIAASYGCEVRKFGQPGVLADKEYLKIKNHVWKGSKADWVILVDADEILHHKCIKTFMGFARAKKQTIFRTQGWQVFSEKMPKKSLLELTDGFKDKNYSKLVIFDPKEITSINYDYGCHHADPQGNVVYADPTLTLFHYRNIGGAQRLVDRHKQYRKRLSPLNKELGLGCHYNYTDERRIREWNEQLAKSGSFSPDGH